MTNTLKIPILLYKVKKIFYTLLNTITNQNTAVSTTKHIQAEQALKKYGNTILRLSYSYLHNLQDAEDILQDTLLQYIKTKPVFIDEEHTKRWLLRVSANLSKNKIKYNKRREYTELNNDTALEVSEDLSFVWESVKKLPPNYSEVIHLYYYEGYSTKDIANILSKKDSTVRSNLKRAREILKAMLKEEYDFEI